ncbi:MAG: hypothetical protein NTX28_00015, partial [Novosphingobium sp.]|nr:hypothetical protein [Novosphingobium sp.]
GDDISSSDGSGARLAALRVGVVHLADRIGPIDDRIGRRRGFLRAVAKRQSSQIVPRPSIEA